MKLLDIVNFEKRKEKIIAKLREENPEEFANIERVVQASSSMNEGDAEKIALVMPHLNPNRFMINFFYVPVIVAGNALTCGYTAIDLFSQGRNKEAIAFVGISLGFGLASYLVGNKMYDDYVTINDFLVQSRKLRERNS